MSIGESSEWKPRFDELVALNKKIANNLFAKIFNQKTVDVHFVFECDGERIPTHKSLLAAASPVFHAMFYGQLKEQGDIKIVDISSTAFKEFLQFFYEKPAKLTMQNIVEILNYINKYEVIECMSICEKFLQSHLTPSNVCWNVHLVQLYNLKHLQRDCEIKVCEMSSEVFGSNSFVNCDRLALKSILQLPTFTCDESVVFDACIKWAQIKCIEQRIDEKAGKNLRDQLGDCFMLIRYMEMSMEEFIARLTSYKGMFTATELEDIFEAFQANKFKTSRIRCVPKMFLRENPSYSLPAIKFGGLIAYLESG